MRNTVLVVLMLMIAVAAKGQQSLAPGRAPYYDFTTGIKIGGSFGGAGACLLSTGTGSVWGTCGGAGNLPGVSSYNTNGLQTVGGSSNPFNDFVEQSSAPANPPSGSARSWVDNAGEWYCKLSSGLYCSLASASLNGLVNPVFNNTADPTCATVATDAINSALAIAGMSQQKAVVLPPGCFANDGRSLIVVNGVKLQGSGSGTTEIHNTNGLASVAATSISMSGSGSSITGTATIANGHYLVNGAPFYFTGTGKNCTGGSIDGSGVQMILTSDPTVNQGSSQSITFTAPSTLTSCSFTGGAGTLNGKYSPIAIVLKGTNAGLSGLRITNSGLVTDQLASWALAQTTQAATACTNSTSHATITFSSNTIAANEIVNIAGFTGTCAPYNGYTATVSTADATHINFTYNHADFSGSDAGTVSANPVMTLTFKDAATNPNIASDLTAFSSLLSGIGYAPIYVSNITDSSCTKGSLNGNGRLLGTPQSGTASVNIGARTISFPIWAESCTAGTGTTGQAQWDLGRTGLHEASGVVNQATGYSVSDVEIDGGYAFGYFCSGCSAGTEALNTVKLTTSDGFHYGGCAHDNSVAAASTFATGDDSFAVVSQPFDVCPTSPDGRSYGISFSGITSEQSAARGFTVAGGRDITLAGGTITDARSNDAVFLGAGTSGGMTALDSITISGLTIDGAQFSAIDITAPSLSYLASGIHLSAINAKELHGDGVKANTGAIAVTGTIRGLQISSSQFHAYTYGFANSNSALSGIQLNGTVSPTLNDVIAEGFQYQGIVANGNNSGNARITNFTSDGNNARPDGGAGRAMADFSGSGFSLVDADHFAITNSTASGSGAFTNALNFGVGDTGTTYYVSRFIGDVLNTNPGGAHQGLKFQLQAGVLSIDTESAITLCGGHCTGATMGDVSHTGFTFTNWGTTSLKNGGDLRGAWTFDSATSMTLPAGATIAGQLICRANGVNCSGSGGGGLSITNVTAATCTASSGMYVNRNTTTTTAVTCTLPAPSAGAQICLLNATPSASSTLETGALKLLVASPSTQNILLSGTITTTTNGYIQSTGAAGDMACVTGLSSTQWQANPSGGSWTAF